MSPLFKYPRGSEWRKWDLHVHTPGTKLNDNYSLPMDNNKGFSQIDDAKWEKFFYTIEHNKIAVVGITDYFCIDNYKYVFSIKDLYLTTDTLFLPNIEFRIAQKNKDSEFIQIHVIFSSEISIKKIENFLARLPLISTDKHDMTNKYCSSDDLQEVSYKKALVNERILKEQLEKDFVPIDDYLIVGVARGYGSIRPGKNDDGRASEYAKEIDKICHLFFGNANDTDFYLNKNMDRGINVSKPVICCSDSHNYSDLGSKFTWIKSNPTYNGLIQVLYEPEERVRIQEAMPEQKKNYLIIDHVVFKDNNFTSKELFLNENLTAIIGGKSTGKSILLRSIARSVDNVEVSKRLSEVGISDYDKNIEDFIVYWKDKQISRLSDVNKINKRIIYIPQSYLNRLVDKKDDVSAINNIIQYILLQDNKVRDAFTTLESMERDTQQNIAIELEQLFFIIDDLEKQREMIKTIGDRIGVQKEINILEARVESLKNESGMTAKEIDQLNNIEFEIRALNKAKTILENDIKELYLIRNYDISISVNTTQLSEETGLEINRLIKNLKEEFETKWATNINNYINSLKKELDEIVSGVDYYNKKYQPYLNKLEQAILLKEITGALFDETNRLDLISKEEKVLDNLTSQYNSTMDKLRNILIKLFEEYVSTREMLLSQNKISGNLKLDINIIFKNEIFQNNFIEEVINLRKAKHFSEVDLTNYKFVSSTDFLRDLGLIVTGLINKELITKNNYSTKEALKRLLQNWFTINYQLTYDGDSISEMSPGKKSYVLLKLLIELDNSQCPILLDQPEDDLDNRSIYSELVNFIKSKKKDRQIIIVTHNPNLVVGADSEEVIIANQHGDKNKNKEYRFEYISGALEDSYTNNNEDAILYKKGIQEHVCDILEGGKRAFEHRKNKYNIKSNNY